ncbi:Sulfite reductase [ferredoxin] 2 [Geodia barretti]|uniref:Ferredoxin--nitrite reductase, chloroplastic n=1 Tax=Geodia barretti TaxID=519541 RepID=A0AA35T847_GEOBA|nr:Sulfite reductase [ferredoxin] 2 [Geodia barretti]
MNLAPDATGIIPFMEDEIVRFDAEVDRFRSGELDNTVFTPFRLRQGVYGQRQVDVQMIRVKLPGGIASADMLDALGEVAEHYAPLQKGHITTRENIQFHHVPLDQTSTALRLLGKVGLSTREACGNTVRNVVGPATAGVSPEETFDPTPYLTAYVRFGVRHPITQNFPRKFKTAFTGNDQRDEVAAAIQDLTFVSQYKEIDGEQRKGFKVYCGGGTSIMPRLAKPLYDWVSEDDYLRVALAIWTVFNNADILRKNRMMARLKVLIDKIGLDEFKQMVETELAGIGPIDHRPLMVAQEIQRETPPAQPAEASTEDSPEYRQWYDTNVAAQRQEGYHVFHGLANIVREYAGGNAHTTQEQNLVIRWVPTGHLATVWRALVALNLGEPGHDHITNVVSCPGTDSCKLGITSSMGLAEALRSEMQSWNGMQQDAGVKDIRIKMSGCPNGCGLHHIANIGFHGAAVKGVDGQQIPSYELFLGGNYGDNRVEDSRIGTRVPKVKVPAKLVPSVLKEIVTFYMDNRDNETERFNDFLERVGIEEVTSVAARAQEIGHEAEGGGEMYFDWERTNQYVLERGEGECAV